MLRATKQLLRERGRLSLRELALHFDMAPDALEPVLQVLVDKGQVCLLEPGRGPACAGCASACREDGLIYELKD
jgi:hypothetical protein